ncbi:hypothetical protein L228DRAFT_31109 [Xylona heveae TC161]|uniref:Uncharacterized protein n=1 Tax=Xylona heveae (strain CBS 132557 / TC161) TaxID=1328760 RepID=A0A165A3D7_XYLHT|nr:hypothetical protein L228DRAFT_31109 [Xylona heveae TC161]KZF19896.1 hypothetical protein L228DRAFT_31109 [Xylona heveae TC161]
MVDHSSLCFPLLHFAFLVLCSLDRKCIISFGMATFFFSSFSSFLTFIHLISKILLFFWRCRSYPGSYISYSFSYSFLFLFHSFVFLMDHGVSLFSHWLLPVLIFSFFHTRSYGSCLLDLPYHTFNTYNTYNTYGRQCIHRIADAFSSRSFTGILFISFMGNHALTGSTATVFSTWLCYLHYYSTRCSHISYSTRCSYIIYGSLVSYISYNLR